METFKTIPSFPDYEISNFGRARTKARPIRYTHARTGKEHFRLTTSRFLKVQYNNYTGYKFYQPYRNKKMHNKPIHQLVADAFLSKIDGLNYINHKDGNKHNNIVENLEWCTNEYNHKHATDSGLKAKGERVGSSKLNERCVSAIKYFIAHGVGFKQIAKAFDISRPTISLISAGKIWKHLK